MKSYDRNTPLLMEAIPLKKDNQLRSISSVMILMLAGKLLSLLANQVYLSYFGADNEQLNIFSWVLQIPN